ncbi:unnamed protein product [Meloidogyne enterolobii]|uniref:Uncharacterized protein n=1 Tax=Meloidogyne enterolobii TaxID=390850 RepID=A0ACB0YWI6_MELEN
MLRVRNLLKLYSTLGVYEILVFNFDTCGLFEKILSGTSRSFTFPSNSPPDILSSNNFRGKRSPTNAKVTWFLKFISFKNNNSWVATQPKLNAKLKRGYILFSAEVRKRVMNENPETRFGEVSEIIGIEWACLSDEDKRDYESRAQFVAAERAKAELLTPNSKLPQANDLIENKTEKLNNLSGDEYAVSILIKLFKNNFFKGF